MDINFYSDLSDAQNVDTEFLDSQAYGGYSGENKVKYNFKWTFNVNGL